MQTYALPVEFASQTLSTITINSFGLASGGEPFITSATVDSVPVPASLFLFGTGLLGLKAWRKRRQ